MINNGNFADLNSKQLQYLFIFSQVVQLQQNVLYCEQGIVAEVRKLSKSYFHDGIREQGGYFSVIKSNQIVLKRTGYSHGDLLQSGIFSSIGFVLKEAGLSNRGEKSHLLCCFLQFHESGNTCPSRVDANGSETKICFLKFSFIGIRIHKSYLLNQGLDHCSQAKERFIQKLRERKYFVRSNQKMLSFS